jgi:hypothetical protein
VLDKTVPADHIATTQNFQGFSPDVAKRMEALPELQAVTSSRDDGWRLDGKPQGLRAVDPSADDSMVRTETTSGSIADLQNGGVAVGEDLARAARLEATMVRALEPEGFRVFTVPGAQRLGPGRRWSPPVPE